MISEGSCDTENWSNDAEKINDLGFFLCFTFSFHYKIGCSFGGMLRTDRKNRHSHKEQALVGHIITFEHCSRSLFIWEWSCSFPLSGCCSAPLRPLLPLSLVSWSSARPSISQWIPKVFVHHLGPSFESSSKRFLFTCFLGLQLEEDILYISTLHKWVLDIYLVIVKNYEDAKDPTER